MGNHTAGTAMGLTADGLLARRTSESALELLDTICKPYTGCDAEFESVDPNDPTCSHPDYPYFTDPAGPLGRLIIEAFDDSGTDWLAEQRALIEKDASCEEWDEYSERWYEGPYGRFQERYRFC